MRSIVKNSSITLIVLLVCIMISPESLMSQILGKPGYGKFAITDVVIHTVTNGVIEGGVVLIENGTITHVGNNVRITQDYQRIEGAGNHLYPGFIDSYTHLGLVEISAVSVTVDNREIGSFNPQIRAFTAINPHSVAIPVTRVEGVTNTISAPVGGRISGKATLIDLWGYSPDSLAVKENAALVLNWPTVMRSGSWDSRSDEEIQDEFEEEVKEIEEYLNQALFYDRMTQTYSLSPDMGIRPAKNSAMEAMREVVRGELPVIINVSREKDILNAIEWTKKYEEISFVFRGVEEGWRVANRIAEAGIPCIVNTLYMPTRPYDNYQRPYQNPGLLQHAGVTVLMGTGQTENVRNVIFEAGYAAAYGMGREEALKAMTINPATVWNVDDRLGSIEEGKQANLVLADGDPLEPSTQIIQVFINGYSIPMESRHTQLYDEFLNRDAINR